MESTKGKTRRMRGDCRGCILKATITNGAHERFGYAVDYRRDFTDYLKEQDLLAYACNYYTEGDPRILWYIQGTSNKLQMAIGKGKRYNNRKRDDGKNLFTYSTKKYEEVYLPTIPYYPSYSTCDLDTFSIGLLKTYGKTEH